MDQQKYFRTKTPPTFDIAVEIHDSQTWIIHDNIENSVDLLLKGQNPLLQKRNLTNDQDVNINCEISYNKEESHKTHHLKSNIPVKNKKRVFY